MIIKWVFSVRPILRWAQAFAWACFLWSFRCDPGGIMLKIVQNMRELNFAALMEIYNESNRNHGREFWPQLDSGQQLIRAEQDFYQYLREVFFPTKDAVYCLWEVHGRCVSALRLEPYRDGLLLAALETAPQDRGRGYASALVREVQRWRNGFGPVVLYSHVHKKNLPSRAVHEACGFRRILDYAVYADGSVMNNSLTLLYKGL
jgi:RimJ/RimL family protein N-acetyltransferase